MAKRTASREAQMRKFVLRMQTVLDMRLQLRGCSWPMLAAWLDMQWRIAGARIVDEMRRLEGGNGRAA